MKVPRRKLPSPSLWQRQFSVTARKREIRDIKDLPDQIRPTYQETRDNDLLSLQWPAPPRNILLVKKDCVPAVTASLIEFANHIHSTYPNLSLILEPHVASSVHSSLPFHIFTTPDVTPTPNSPSPSTSPTLLHSKVDLITTLGGDGTILHASSLFSTTSRVPPILSFSMGTLGFLSEWRFSEHKRAFREVYMSGAGLGDRDGALGGVESAPQAFNDEHADAIPAARSAETRLTGSGRSSSVRGKSMGWQRGAKVLLRNRLKVGVFDAAGTHIKDPTDPSASASGYTYAMNEVHIHRGALPHLAVVQVSVGGRFLTEAVADGIIVSTPTGSTAYSLSSGGSIVHPLVASLLLTPICPRSLSFRPLVLPANTPVVLRLSEKNRGREVEVSVDGVRRGRGVGVGMEVRVVGEEVRRVGGGGGGGRQEMGADWEAGDWEGGIPCIVRGNAGPDGNGDDGWVGGLNGLLKFNYPFGEEN